jgi:hypothetical protein
MAILLQPEILKRDALSPALKLPEPVVLLHKEVPSAIFCDPVEFCDNDSLPIAIFLYPVVLENNDCIPIDTLLFPVVLEYDE